MRNDAGEFLHGIEDRVADEQLIKSTAVAMRSKLGKKRQEGRGGWHGLGCNNARLMGSLREHISKGDMVDVINFAAMIHMRKELLGDVSHLSLTEQTGGGDE